MLLSVYLPKWAEKFRCLMVIHESAVCILLGLATGGIIKAILGDLSKFSASLFFNFMLPIIILGAGYNMKRRRFFRNIGPILMLGVGGTFVSFIVIGMSTYYWSERDLIKKNGEVVHIEIQEAFMVGATLSATDVVCGLALIKENKTPRLHSILFGEATSNDAIAILLLASLKHVNINNLDAESVFSFMGEFLYNCISSILLGILFGVISALVTKTFRSLRSWPGRETAILLYVAWIGYIVADILEISGVICILVCSIISGHYALYNLSPTSRVVSQNFFHFIGDGAEALVFAYLGLTAYSYEVFSISPWFIAAMLLGTLIARFIGTYILSFIITLVTCGRHRMGIRYLSTIWLGGIVRGGISFALALTYTGDHAEVLQITVLAYVIVGVLIFSSFLPLWIILMNAQEDPTDVAPVDGHDAGTGEKPQEERGWLHQKWKNLDDNYIKRWLIHEDELSELKRNREH